MKRKGFISLIHGWQCRGYSELQRRREIPNFQIPSSYIKVRRALLPPLSRYRTAASIRPIPFSEKAKLEGRHTSQTASSCNEDSQLRWPRQCQNIPFYGVLIWSLFCLPKGNVISLRVECEGEELPK